MPPWGKKLSDLGGFSSSHFLEILVVLSQHVGTKSIVGVASDFTVLKSLALDLDSGVVRRSSVDALVVPSILPKLFQGLFSDKL
jgi:hypothetical protein